ncbi:MAG: helix-turn-helix transcriptional regulator [Lachnospiraceae bacterium]|nr:helix-turn-helix transcriptional regulator [Lachnospiraceae bacterium]
MKILIGENIKQLRKANNITQEQLAEALNITCAAVSKWERGDTYPDITLLQPLAYFFGVTLDELMGYQASKIQKDIDELIARYTELYRTDCEAARKLIVKAHAEYPNDYQIMHCYMWNLAGDYADNNPQNLLSHKTEFLEICERILEGCKDNYIRRDALNMQAKLLWAEGKTEDALAIYQQNLPDWYGTAGQKSEQLFPKDTPEFLYHARKNLYELADFAADKMVKVIFYDTCMPFEERIKKAEHYGDLLADLSTQTLDAAFTIMAASLFCRLANDLKWNGGNEADISRVQAKLSDLLDMLSSFTKTDEILATYNQAMRKF